MIIVLINWRIITEKENEFLDHWRSTLTVTDRIGLIGEFLSKVQDESYYDRITWQIGPSEDEDKALWNSETYISYVNVGFWRSIEDFDTEIRKHMKPTPQKMAAFEAAPRRRAVLTPEAWRIGEAKLAEFSSEGVS